MSYWNHIFKIGIVLFFNILFSQQPQYIKTITFKGNNNQNQFPIIKFGESFLLQFDDIRTLEENYYYEITHCNYSWKPSNLSKAQYLKGFDNQIITNISNSRNTLQSFSHYELKLPNSNTSFLISGNYILSIQNDEGETIFIRRFILYKDFINISAEVKRSENLEYRNQKQTLHFKIFPIHKISNPTENIQIKVIQNYDWNTSKKNITHQYIASNALVYSYNNDKTSFWASNEYLNFSTKNIRNGNVHTKNIERDSLYHHIIYPNKPRNHSPYTYYPDINGSFSIDVVNSYNKSIEADYVLVSFELLMKKLPKNQSIYIYGNFCNYTFSKSNKMTFDNSSHSYKAILLLKQGIYNYKHAVLENKKLSSKLSPDGNFWQTENNYTIVVYYKNFSLMTDTIIGILNVSSEKITN